MSFRLGACLAVIALLAASSAIQASAKHLSVTMNALNGSGQTGTAVLSPVVDGRSVTTLPAPTSTSGNRAIVVHKGTGADMKTYVACGDIPAP